MISTSLPLPDPLAALAGPSATMPAPVLGEDMLPDFSALVAGLMPSVADDMAPAPLPPRPSLPGGRQEAAAALPDDREPAPEEEGVDADLLSWFDPPVAPDAMVAVTVMPARGLANAGATEIAAAPLPVAVAPALRGERGGEVGRAPALPVPPSSTLPPVAGGAGHPSGKAVAGAPLPAVDGGMPLAELIEHPGEMPAPALRPVVRENVEQRIARLLATTAGPVAAASPMSAPITASAPAPSPGSAPTPILAPAPLPTFVSARAQHVGAMLPPVAVPASGGGSALSPIIASGPTPHAGGDRPVVAPPSGADRMVDPERPVAAHVDLPAPPVSRPADEPAPVAVVRAPAATSHAALPVPPESVSVRAPVSAPTGPIPDVSQAGVEPPRLAATGKSAGPVTPRPLVVPAMPAAAAAPIATDTAVSPDVEAVAHPASEPPADCADRPAATPASDAIVRPSPAPEAQRVAAPMAETVAPVAAPAAPMSATPAAAVPAPMTLPTLDTARADWIDALVERIEIVRAADGLRHVQMKLAPDALGAIDVRVEQRPRGEIAVHVEAQTPQGRTAIAEAAPRLAEMVEARGLKLAESGIDGGRGGFGGDRRQPQAEPPQPERPAAARSTSSDIEASAAADRLA